MQNIDNLISDFCKFLNIEEEKLLSISRKRELVDARHWLILLCREDIKLQQAESGYHKNKIKVQFLYKKLNKKHHSSIANSIRESKKLIETDKAFSGKYLEIKTHLLNLGYKTIKRS